MNQADQTPRGCNPFWMALMDSTFGDIIPGIKKKVEVLEIVTTTGIKNSRN